MAKSVKALAEFRRNVLFRLIDLSSKTGDSDLTSAWCDVALSKDGTSNSDICRIYCRKADEFISSGDISKGEYLLDIAGDIPRLNRRARATVALSKAAVASARRDHPSAVAFIECALQIADGTSSTLSSEETDNAKLELAAELVRAGDAAKAKPIYTKFIRKSRPIGDRVTEGKCLDGMSRIARIGGNLQEARELALQSVSLREKIGDIVGTIETRLHLADMALADGKSGGFKAGIRELEYSLKKAQNATIPELTILTKRLLGQAYYRRGREKKNSLYVDQSISIFHGALDDARSLKKLIELLLLHEDLLKSCVLRLRMAHESGEKAVKTNLASLAADYKAKALMLTSRISDPDRRKAVTRRFESLA